MKSRCIALLAIICWVCSVPFVFSEEATETTTTKQTSNVGASLSAPSVDASSNIMLARSSADYRVTPGDVYTLAYAAGGTPVSYVITVDSTYRVRVSNLGIVNGAGKTFVQLKNEIETIVANNYPLSGVQLVLTQPSIFRVYVKGEVYTAGEVSAWGLSRLSSLAGANLTGRASLRDISIQSSNGQTRTYDLFKAQRLADFTQDPYLRPGDVVSFNRVSRVVTINGAVERPGTYQILAGEQLKNLIDVYANGYTPVADKTRISLVRYVDSIQISGDRILLSEQDIAANYELQDYDVITIPAITSFRPAVPVNRAERTITIDGAVRRPGTYELMPNENLQALIEVYGDGFTPLADKTRITLVRYVDSVEISGDKKVLSEQELSGNYELRHLDVITIPSITDLRPAVPVNRVERTITIDGAVRRPGTYELMSYENLKELIEVYADGFTPLADKTRVTLVRYVDSVEVSGDKKVLSEQELSGNYELRHLDVITIPAITDLRPLVYMNRVERTITINGAVRRPGTYELMPDENLKVLLEVYADGFTPIADKTRLELVRYMGSSSISGDKLILSTEDIDRDFSLQHYDVITIPSVVDLRPVLFVEGAVSAIENIVRGESIESVTDSNVGSTTRLVVPFNRGEDYAALVRRNRLWFSAISDTQNAYIIRQDKRVPINLNPMLYDERYRSILLVEDNDTLIIPFRQYFVTVAGAVINPGRYPYIPDRDWEYYIGLAGGFIPERNSMQQVAIVDLEGKRKKKSDAITPETTITASTNHALYYFNQYAPVITTVLTVVSAIFSVQAYISTR